MTFTVEQKQYIYTAYMSWCNQVADDLEDKTYFTADELVMKTISLIEPLVKEILDENVKLKEINEKLIERLKWATNPGVVYKVK